MQAYYLGLLNLFEMKKGDTFKIDRFNDGNIEKWEVTRSCKNHINVKNQNGNLWAMPFDRLFNVTEVRRKYYNYQGALEPVKVKVMVFGSAPDFILEAGVFEMEGGAEGLSEAGVIYIDDLVEVYDGTMHPTDFDNLGEWEG